MTKKTIVFYGRDGKAAKEKHQAVEQDTYQVVQADAYSGERLEGDAIEFMDDVPAGDQARIRELWKKHEDAINAEKKTKEPHPQGLIARIFHPDAKPAPAIKPAATPAAPAPAPAPAAAKPATAQTPIAPAARPTPAPAAATPADKPKTP